MTGFEDDLRGLLRHEADRAAPGNRRNEVIGRVTRRRAARAGGAAFAAAVIGTTVLAGGGDLLSTFDDPTGRDASHRAAAPPPGSSSTPDAYPGLATGTHDGRNWSLYVRSLGGPREVVFEIDGPYATGAFDVHSRWDVVDASYRGRIPGSGDYVMGMVDADVDRVTIVGVDQELEASIYGYEETRYFLAFVPRGSGGLAVARTKSGSILGSEELPRGEGRTVQYECPRDYEDSPGDERFPALGRGTFDGREWVVSLIEDPDAAHPEDTESDNPELLFEIEGPWPNAGAIETHTGWDGLSEPFYDRLDGRPTYMFGMAAPSVASVTVETDDGNEVTADLFDAQGVPSPGSQVYVAFLPDESTGELVARDDNGDVLARRPLPPLPSVPLCKES